MAACNPISFTGRALEWGLNSNALFPTNKGNTHTFKEDLGKMGRGIARYFFATAVQVSLSVPGTVYHFGKAAVLTANSLIDEKGAKSLRAHAWKHIKAGGQDLAAFFFLTLNLILPIVGNIPAFSYGYEPIKAAVRFQPENRRFECFVKLILKETTGMEIKSTIQVFAAVLTIPGLYQRKKEIEEIGISGFFNDFAKIIEHAR